LRSSSRGRFFRILSTCALCLLAARPAAAEWHITPMIGVTFSGRTTLIDPQDAAGSAHADVGGAVTLLGAGILGAEAIVVLTPGFFQKDQSGLSADAGRVEIKSSRTIAVMGNAVVTTPRRWTEYSLRPFVSGGFGLLHASQTPVVEVFPLHPSMAGFNVGGGAIGFLSPRTGVRFDLRYYGTVHGTDRGPGVSVGLARLHYMTAAVGLVIRR
jgi:hypothetical protein